MNAASSAEAQQEEHAVEWVATIRRVGCELGACEPAKEGVVEGRSDAKQRIRKCGRGMLHTFMLRREGLSTDESRADPRLFGVKRPGRANKHRRFRIDYGC